MWELWISEIVADFWAVCQTGITATIGLMSVVHLPRVFVFRVGTDDPHPVPWIRVLLSCALGEAVYPHPQWRKAARLWRSLYPLRDLDPSRLNLLRQLEATIPEVARLIVTHRPAPLRGRTIPEALEVEQRRPERLMELFERCRPTPDKLSRVRPTLALAVLGQARAEGRLGPESESRTLDWLFREWALRRARIETKPERAQSCRCAAAAR
jgi:hypothetical protein